MAAYIISQVLQSLSMLLNGTKEDFSLQRQINYHQRKSPLVGRLF